MKDNKLNNEGFSFIETVIAVAIFIYIVVALLVIYNGYSKFYRFQQAKMSAGGSAREAVKELQSAALQANKIVSSHNFSGIDYATGTHSVVLEIPSINGSGNVISDKYDYVVFYATGKNLYRRVQVDAASSRPSGLNKISDVLKTVNFTYNNSDLALATKIDTDLEMQANVGNQTVSYPLHQAIYLRNL